MESLNILTATYNQSNRVRQLDDSMFVLRCVVLMMSFSGRPSLNVLRCSNVRPDRMMLSSNMPMGLWAMSEYERKPATLNGYSLYIYKYNYIYVYIELYIIICIAFKWQLGLCQWVCLLHSGVPKIIKESDLMVEAASHRLQATPFPRLPPSQAIKTRHEERSKSFHMAGRYHVQPWLLHECKWLHATANSVLYLRSCTNWHQPHSFCLHLIRGPHPATVALVLGRISVRVMKCKRSIEIHKDPRCINNHNYF